MKPQELTLECELFNEFREALDTAIKNCMRQMVSKRLNTGTISGKIEITLMEDQDENGEVIFHPEIEPDVAVKIGAKGNIKCQKKVGIIMKCSPDGFVVGTDQVTMDELIRGKEAEADA